jgi:myo-inositol catabolism protein IolS
MNKISSICFGCEPLGGTDWGNVDIKAIEHAVNTALDLGLNFVDTAGVYGLGLSEKRLSRILGKRRHDVVIATKGGLRWDQSESKRKVILKDSSPESIRNDVESSLRRLKLDILPIFYVHWPDSNTKIEDTFFELLKLKNEGKIKSIGCSNFSAKQLDIASNVCKIEYVQLPVNILDGPPNKNISEICTNKKIKIIAYNVLLNGLLTGKFDQNSSFPKNDRRSRLSIFKGSTFLDVLKKVDKLKIEAENVNNSLAHYSIDWVLKQENIISVVIGIKSTDQIIDNWSVKSNLI